MDIVQKIKASEWMTDWEVETSLMQVFVGIKMYTEYTAKIFDVESPIVLIYFEKGHIKGQFIDEQYQRIGEELAIKAQDEDYLHDWCEAFKKLGDKLIAAVDVSPEEFLSNFNYIQELYQQYGAYQFATKTAYNFLGPTYKDIQDKLEQARKHSETFYHDASKMFEKIDADIIAGNLEYKLSEIDCMTDDELREYIASGALPDRTILQDRYKGALIFGNESGIKILSSEAFHEVKKFREENARQIKELQGQIAQKGKVSGIVRVIRSYKNAEINEGEILVTGMTDPNFLPLMKKAAAIVTDGGGLLCHAAIVARELKKPCIIGTKIATSVLKDGMEVEVDAENGVVKIIE